MGRFCHPLGKWACLLSFAVLSSCSLHFSQAQVSSANPSTEKLADSLHKTASKAWFDRAQGKVIRPRFVKAHEAQVPLDWESKDTSARRVIRPTAGGTSGDSWIVPAGIFAGLLLVGLIVLAYRWRAISGLGMFSSTRSSVNAVPARAEELPFELPPTEEGLLELVRRLADEGQFGRAMVPLYGYQLLHLDAHGLIHLAKGKTNRQYYRELRGSEPISTILLNTICTFERAFFGGHQIARDDFEQCWNRLDAFHQAALVPDEKTHAIPV